MPRPANPSRGPVPITAHPLFATALALWCGALGGLSVMAVGGPLFERIALAAHMDAAALHPRLAHLLVAAVVGLSGGLVGWTAGKALRPRHQARANSAPRAETGRWAGIAGWPGKGKPDARAPFQVHDHFASMAAARAPSEPMGSEQIGTDWPVIADVTLQSTPEPWPAEAEHTSPPLASPTGAAQIAPAPLAFAPLAQIPLAPAPLALVPDAAPAKPASPPRAAALDTGAARIAAATLADLNHVELLERLAIALGNTESALGNTESGERLHTAATKGEMPQLTEALTKLSRG